jgi:hypothetical protein
MEMSIQALRMMESRAMLRSDLALRSIGSAVRRITTGLLPQFAPQLATVRRIPILAAPQYRLNILMAEQLGEKRRSASVVNDPGSNLVSTDLSPKQIMVLDVQRLVGENKLESDLLAAKMIGEVEDPAADLYGVLMQRNSESQYLFRPREIGRVMAHMDSRYVAELLAFAAKQGGQAGVEWAGKVLLNTYSIDKKENEVFDAAGHSKIAKVLAALYAGSGIEVTGELMKTVWDNPNNMEKMITVIYQLKNNKKTIAAYNKIAGLEIFEGVFSPIAQSKPVPTRLEATVAAPTAATETSAISAADRSDAGPAVFTIDKATYDEIMSQKGKCLTDKIKGLLRKFKSHEDKLQLFLIGEMSFTFTAFLMFFQVSMTA